jgi:hypothetical protein
VADLWNRTPAASQLAVIQADGTLAAALTTVFNETSAAANGFIADLRANPEEIWRYHNAIYPTLKALHLNQGDVAWRAIEDHLIAVSGEMSPVAQLSMGLGLVEMLAAGLAVAPPVAVVLAVLSAAAGVAELIENAVNEARKDRAFDACLDPSESLAVEPGSYTGLVVGALFMLFQIRGAGKGLVKALAVP